VPDRNRTEENGGAAKPVPVRTGGVGVAIPRTRACAGSLSGPARPRHNGFLPWATRCCKTSAISPQCHIASTPARGECDVVGRAVAAQALIRQRRRHGAGN
jgi:hypothetical protein